MGSIFFQLNLADVPPPDAVEMLDFEVILEQYLADTAQRLPELERAIRLNQSPTNVIHQSIAYGDMLVRARINAAVRAVLLATSTGADLDNLGAFFGVTRMVRAANGAVDPPVTAYRESDTDLRRRIQLAPEAWAAAGPLGAYMFHALSAHPGVETAAIYNHNSLLVFPGQVMVVVLPRPGENQREVVDAVLARLNHPDVKPLTDSVTVIAAKPHLFSIEAKLDIQMGPDKNLVVAEARKRVDALLKARRRIGADISLSSLYAAMTFGPVTGVQMTTPTETIKPPLTHYAEVSGILLTGVTDVDG